MQPILITKAEADLVEQGVISRGTAAQILAHNRAYAAHCRKTK
jgi:hypothetical protein